MELSQTTSPWAGLVHGGPRFKVTASFSNTQAKHWGAPSRSHCLLAPTRCAPPLPSGLLAVLTAHTGAPLLFTCSRENSQAGRPSASWDARSWTPNMAGVGTSSSWTDHLSGPRLGRTTHSPGLPPCTQSGRAVKRAACLVRAHRDAKERSAQKWVREWSPKWSRDGTSCDLGSGAKRGVWILTWIQLLSAWHWASYLMALGQASVTLFMKWKEDYSPHCTSRGPNRRQKLHQLFQQKEFTIRNCWLCMKFLPRHLKG